jgi:tellurite resistance protein TehA-like permease
MTVGLIGFTIANILTSMLGTVIYKQEYQKANKYIVFSLFFIGYFLFFYLLSKK